MSDDQHLTDTPGHADAVAHAEDSLGPIDAPAWGAGLIGVLLGLAVVLAFVLATGEIPPA